MSARSANDAASLHEYFDAFNRQDVDAWVALSHPDVTLVPTPFWAPPGTSYHGHAGVRTYAHEIFGRFPNLHSEPPELTDLGDRILGCGAVATGSDHSSESSRTVACLFTLQEEQIYRVDAFATRAEALEAAGPAGREQFRELFEPASDAVLLSDDWATLIEANASACDLFGVSIDQLRGRTIFEFLPSELISQAEALWQDLRTRGQCTSELEIVSATGERSSVLLRARVDFVPGQHLLLLTAQSGSPRDAELERAEPRLTAREHEVFRLLALGFSGSEIAERLMLSPHTVRRHVEKGIARLEAKNRVQAIAIALTSGEIKL